MWHGSNLNLAGVLSLKIITKLQAKPVLLARLIGFSEPDDVVLNFFRGDGLLADVEEFWESLVAEQKDPMLLVSVLYPHHLR